MSYERALPTRDPGFGRVSRRERLQGRATTRQFSAHRTRITPTQVVMLGRPLERVTPGLQFSLKPPKFLRKAASAIAKVAAVATAPVLGTITGSSRAPAFLRAPKSVRSTVRTIGKVGAIAGAAVVGGALAVKFAPTLLSAGASLFKGGAALVKGELMSKPGQASPPIAAPSSPPPIAQTSGAPISSGDVPGDSTTVPTGQPADMSAGGGGGGGPAPDAMTPADQPAQAGLGDGALPILGLAALALFALSSSKPRRRKVA